MNTRLNWRLTKLEGRYLPGRRDPEETAEERLRRGVLYTLSPGELEVMRDYAEQLQEDPNAKPDAVQTAAFEAYEQRYRMSKSNRELVVDGWPAEV